jgi:NAD(P)-dependent dehydrogenase (short-subunit alcohol dehydrogenase family)
MGRLDGKVAILTGSTEGIGKACARLFAREGAKVVVAGRNVDKGDEVVRQIEQERGISTYVRTDVSKPDDIKNLIKKAVETYGKLDIMMNNAAVQNTKPLLETSEEEWDQVINTNLKAVFLGCKYAIPEMMKVGGGVIINTSSTFAIVGSPGYAAYHASKGGISSLSRHIALAYIKDNIRCNCLNPGTTDTPGLHRGAETTAKDPEAAMRSYLDLQPMGRFGTSEEIAYGALFLASDESSFMIGAELVIDGGYTIV